MTHTLERVMDNPEDYVFCKKCFCLNHIENKTCIQCDTKIRKLSANKRIKENAAIELFALDSVQEYQNETDWSTEYEMFEFEPHFVDNNEVMLCFFEFSKEDFFKEFNDEFSQEEYNNTKLAVKEFDLTIGDFNGDSFWKTEIDC